MLLLQCDLDISSGILLSRTTVVLGEGCLSCNLIVAALFELCLRQSCRGRDQKMNVPRLMCVIIHAFEGPALVMQLV